MDNTTTTSVDNFPAIGGKTESDWLFLFAGMAMSAYYARNTGYGANQTDCAKWSIEQAKTLLTELKKE